METSKLRGHNPNSTKAVTESVYWYGLEQSHVITLRVKYSPLVSLKNLLQYKTLMINMQCFSKGTEQASQLNRRELTKVKAPN